MKTRTCFCFLIIALVTIPSAQAGWKEEVVRLQSEIKTLQADVSESNNKNNERLDAIYSLITQLNDEIARSSSTLSRLGATLNSRTEDARGQEASLLDVIREVSQKIDDLSIGYTVLAQQFNDYKLQSTMRAGSSSSLSADTMYNQAMRDYTQGNFDMAIEGFTAYVDTYPGSETSARALLYIGESYSSPDLNMLKEAIDAFTRLINGYPQAAVVPTALYKRARIEIALQEQENAIADLRDIVERFPNATESDLARMELQLLESASAAKPKTAPKATTPAKKR